MYIALVLLPVLAGFAAFLLPLGRGRPLLLPLTGALHLVLTLGVVFGQEAAAPGRWLGLDPLGRLALLVISVLFAVCAFYAVPALRARPEIGNRVFCACLLVVLGMMSLVTLAQHLALLWIAIEATTLTSAPLVYYYGTPLAIEATWKYLLLGSVGVALALLGTFFLAYSTLQGGGCPLSFPDLAQAADGFSKPWLYAAFALLLIGYGTKMGLAPMHTWKPDAYGEAPGVAGAVMAGGLTTCGFLALLRIYHICLAAGEETHLRPLLIGIGLFSMAVAAIFVLGQRDLKRLLAYSSIEQMGILLLGIGIGGAGVFGALLHVVNNAFAKGGLFLCAGNIHRAFGSKNLDEVHGVLRRLPWTGVLFLAGLFAITASPPFGSFRSVFAILNAGFAGGDFWSSILFLVLLLIVFLGMGAAMLAAAQGRPAESARLLPQRDSFLTVATPFLLLSLVFLLGVYLPAPVRDLLQNAADFLEVRP